LRDVWISIEDGVDGMDQLERSVSFLKKKNRAILAGWLKQTVMKAELLYASQCILGESPLWHPERKCCCWVEFENCVLYEYNWIQRTTRNWKFNYRLTLVLQGEGDGLILALDAKIAS
jgi:hypothetical protein